MKTKPVALALAVSATFGYAQAQSVQTLDPVVVTASKFEEPQGQATAIVDVIDRQQIEASGAANITELLDQSPGDCSPASTAGWVQTRALTWAIWAEPVSNAPWCWSMACA